MFGLGKFVKPAQEFVHSTMERSADVHYSLSQLRLEGNLTKEQEAIIDRLQEESDKQMAEAEKIAKQLNAFK